MQKKISDLKGTSVNKGSHEFMFSRCCLGIWTVAQQYTCIIINIYLSNFICKKILELNLLLTKLINSLSQYPSSNSKTYFTIKSVLCVL